MPQTSQRDKFKILNERKIKKYGQPRKELHWSCILMDTGKQIIHEEARKNRADEVKVVFIDGLMQHFNVLATTDEYDKKSGLLKIKEGAIKHMGVLFEKELTTKDVCTCESFQFGNSDDWKKTHGYSFQCKHLLRARSMRFVGYPE